MNLHIVKGNVVSRSDCINIRCEDRYELSVFPFLMNRLLGPKRTVQEVLCHKLVVLSLDRMVGLGNTEELLVLVYTSQDGSANVG